MERIGVREFWQLVSRYLRWVAAGGSIPVGGWCRGAAVADWPVHDQSSYD